MLREDVVQDLLHLYPEFCLIVPQMGRYDVFTLSLFAETDVGPSVRSGVSIDLNVSMGSLKLLGVKYVEDGAWVVNGREWEFIIGEVHALIHLKHVMDSLGEGDMCEALEVIKHVLSRHVLVSHFQGNHYQRYLSL